MVTTFLGGMEMVTSSSGEMKMAIPASLRSGDGQPHDLKVQVAVPYLSKVEVAIPNLLRRGCRWPYHNMLNTILDYITFYKSTLFSTSTPEDMGDGHLHLRRLHFRGDGDDHLNILKKWGLPSLSS